MTRRVEFLLYRMASLFFFGLVLSAIAPTYPIASIQAAFCIGQLIQIWIGPEKAKQLDAEEAKAMEGDRP